MPTLDREPCPVEVLTLRCIVGRAGIGVNAVPTKLGFETTIYKFGAWLTTSALLSMPDYGAAEVEGKYMAHMAKYGPFK